MQPPFFMRLLVTLGASLNAARGHHTSAAALVSPHLLKFTLIFMDYVKCQTQQVFCGVARLAPVEEMRQGISCRYVLLTQ